MQPVPGMEAYIDVEDALKRFLGNKALYKSFVKNFMESAPLDELEIEIAAGNLQAAAKAAHGLKGVIANLSFIIAYEKIVAVESDLKRGFVDGNKMCQLKEALDSTMLYADYIFETF